ncbi:unnamed protein product [Larinioides sclopetarius]|uniref:Peptidase aspartic putative domain-containing protein n=1 Tax=Larinioides sclopetarius TaxID=280406 RepID=A0AAV1YZQ5_9ARAC
MLLEKKLSVFTFGNKTPKEKMYDVVKITLENKNSPKSKIEIEALVTEEICGSNIPPPPNLNEITRNKYLQNLTLADNPTCEEHISLLIGADYYYNIVLGNIKRINKELVAVQTVFGWCLQGIKGENSASMTMNILVEEKLISEQIKKFWDLETSGLINSKEEIDPSENEAMKKFESN